MKAHTPGIVDVQIPDGRYCPNRGKRANPEPRDADPDPLSFCQEAGEVQCLEVAAKARHRCGVYELVHPC